jgi:hypothetical protein
MQDGDITKFVTEPEKYQAEPVDSACQTAQEKVNLPKRHLKYPDVYPKC